MSLKLKYALGVLSAILTVYLLGYLVFCFSYC